MNLPVKRSVSSKRVIQNPNKKPKTKLQGNSSESTFKPMCLRNDLWIEILDYLDTKSYFCIIPLLNSFFNLLIKGCKNYRTSLKVILKFISSTLGNNQYHIEKNPKGMEYILQSRQLNKLELVIRNFELYDDPNPEYKSEFTHFFIPMISLRTLRTLKINFPKNFTREINSLFTLMPNLEVLKVNLNNSFPKEFSFVLDKYIRNFNQTPLTTTTLKKLSLRYHNINQINNSIEDIFDSLEKNTCLEKLSIENHTNKYNETKISKFLKTNSYLKCIKLPVDFVFTKNSADDLCNYLANNEILEELQLSDSIMISAQKFTNAVSNNHSLRILNLKHHLKISERRIYNTTNNACKLFKALSNTLIEDFSMIFSVTNFCDICKTNKKNCKVNFEKSLKSLESFLSASKTLRKISISILYIPLKSISLFAEIIIKYVKLGKIEYFCGYNLKMLLENKIDVFVIKKKNKICRDNIWISIVLYEILGKFLIKADKVLRVVCENNSKIVTNVKDFIENLSLSKNLILHHKQNIENLYLIPSLYYFSILILSTKFEALSELDIRNIPLESCNMAFPELLKQFKSLQKLKFRIKNIEFFESNIPSIFKTIKSNLSKISYINCSLDNIASIKIFEAISQLIISHNTLKYFKLKRYKLLLNKKVPKNKLENFIAMSKLVSLNLTDITINYKYFIHLANGLKINDTITRLKLKEINFENCIENISPFRNLLLEKTNPIYNSLLEIKAALAIINSLTSKTYFEKLCVIISGKLINEILATEDEAEIYLKAVDSFLLTNTRLQKFDVPLEVPNNYIFKLSETLVNAIKNNKDLRIPNCFEEKDFAPNKQIENIPEFKNDELRSIDTNQSSKIVKNEPKTNQCRPLVLSELVKSSNPEILNNHIKKLFGHEIDLNCKSLNLKKSINTINMNYKIYKYNFIEVFTSLQELIICGSFIKPVEIQVIENNIKNLKNLHTIKFKNIYHINENISGLLAPQNLTYLKIFETKLSISDLTRFSEKIKCSCLKKLSLKNIYFFDGSNIKIYFAQLIEAIICPSLEVLKIHIKYTPYLMDFLVDKLDYFENLEFIGIYILERFISFKGSIEKLILKVVNKDTLLSRVKIHKYIWDIKKLYGVENLKIDGCMLCPGDLMIFAEICERKVLENVKSIDLSNNIGVFDGYFVENIVRVVKALECQMVVLKNSGCKKNHVEEIQRLLGKKGSELKFIIA
ncbi:hypothetical protein SteCoe_3827 [Stentor coeruleus]|uniref:Uncharacterized protein n=1 Tax=Stentor coeruleus TaxID=5963 RepID=A0A1R2CW66_9CILI|nr:hypothetical protein SteCoe_3827 [Stentor coeruleus]